MKSYRLSASVKPSDAERLERLSKKVKMSESLIVSMFLGYCLNLVDRLGFPAFLDALIESEKKR